MKMHARIGHRGPQFLGIGAQKAGTTWLYEALSRHPQIRFPAGKELHFWSLRRHHGLEWYLTRFGAAQPGVRQGEITPAYALLADPVIREVQVMNPYLRLLYVLRNPIERAWSSALMALVRAEMEFGEASEAWFVDHFRSAGSLARGDYETTIRRWRSVFGADALLLLRFEDIAARPVDLLMRCARHLDVAEGVFATTNPGVLQARVFNGGGHPLEPRLRTVLHGLYRDRILRLGDYIDWDLSAWLDAELQQPDRARGRLDLLTH